MHLQIRFHLAQVLHEIVSERIVIVDDQDHNPSRNLVEVCGNESPNFVGFSLDFQCHAQSIFAIFRTWQAGNSLISLEYAARGRQVSRLMKLALWFGLGWFALLPVAAHSSL